MSAHPSSSAQNSRLVYWSRAEFVHLVELSARGCDLLDAELAQFRLQLAQLLNQLVLALRPYCAGLDFAGRLHPVSIHSLPAITSKGLAWGAVARREHTAAVCVVA